MKTLSAAIAILFVIVPRPAAAQTARFRIEETTIEEIQSAILRGELTSTRVVELYLNRIKAYNGTCVSQPDGVLGSGPITPIKSARQLNSLMTLNLRPAKRKALEFDARKARSMTDPTDNDPSMPDALEVAAKQDAYFASTGKLVGPLHGIVFSIKDQYDTFDMRTTGGMDAPYANDRPPNDATFVKRLREAGAIILAKANLGEMGTPNSRSSFGGPFCNPYDTTRTPGTSSGGSGSSVAANLVTCSIGEETGGSIHHPAKNNSLVGLAPTQELVSRQGMIGAALNTRVGPLCRTVKDAARVLDVISGYDPKDELTAFSIGRQPSEPYRSFADARTLNGIRIGVIREHMDKKLFNEADAESIDIAERALDDLRRLGATIVDPGSGGALFQGCIDKYAPLYRNHVFIEQFPSAFPPGSDNISSLLNMFFNPSLVPAGPTIRTLGPTPNSGQAKYMLSRYLRERGDANIKTIGDLIGKSSFYRDVRPDAGFIDRKAALEEMNGAATLDMANLFQDRFAYQQVVLQCMAQQNLDAMVSPSGNVPAYVLGAPMEPPLNGRSTSVWGLLGQHGIPTLSVPAGFTTQVFDRVRDSAAPGGARLAGPIPAKLPVGIMFFGRPFSEPTLLRIASAYEAATKHRIPPPEFGPLPEPAPAARPAAQNASAFTVGTASAMRGQKATGVIAVPAGSDAATNIPVAVINGAKPGKVLALVSGAHGTEYASIIALEQLITRLDPQQISGTVIIVPLVNVPSFEKIVPHINPVDGQSMNRKYPGRMEGTQTDRASYLITKQVVERADHLIDLHGGDLDESLRPYSYWTRTGNARQDTISREMVLAFGLDHIIISDRPKDPAASIYLENTASTRGKPSLTVEAGHAGTTEAEDIRKLVDGCLNVMRYLKMIPGEVKPVEHPVWLENVVSLPSAQTGIFYPSVTRGTYVEQGMLIGYVTDYVGNRIFEAHAPASGVVLFIRAVPSMVKGDTIANIGVVGKAPSISP